MLFCHPTARRPQPFLSLSLWTSGSLFESALSVPATLLSGAAAIAHSMPDINAGFETSSDTICPVTDNGLCVQTLNYSNYDACTISMVGITGEVAVSTLIFDTESGYDFLKIAGEAYSGTAGPGSFTVDADDSITWKTDGTVPGTVGWRMCLSSAPRTCASNLQCYSYQSDDCDVPCSINHGFASAECTIIDSGRCVQSLDYRNSEACSIAIEGMENVSGPIRLTTDHFR